MIVMSAGTATPAELEERDRWVVESGAAKHIGVQDAGHWLQLERPDVVIEAVREMLGTP